jgi:hypothetical protein
LYARRVRLATKCAAFVLLAAGAAPSHAAQPALRVLYAGDWTGSMQIFAADPGGRLPLGQVTFGSPGGACRAPTACGWASPRPSPDGRRVAYWTTPSLASSTLYVADASGTHARAIGEASAAAWSPDSRTLAYAAADGVHLGGRLVLRRVCAGPLSWSPDGGALAMLCGGELVVLRGGRARTLARDVLSSLAWSPDGRSIAYGTPQGISELPARGGRARTLWPAPSGLNRVFLAQLELAFAPDGRTLAFAAGTVIRMLDTRTLGVRPTRAAGHDLDWAPDGSRLLFVQGSESGDGSSITTGDVQTVTRDGHIRTVVAAAKPYGGQIVDAAWAATPAGVRYRPPETVDGTFAGGPVQELAADAGRVAFISCGRVSVWTPATGVVTPVSGARECEAPYSRQHAYTLGLAGDRVFWLEKGYGLCFQWTANEATVGAAPLAVGNGYGCLGAPPPDGIGTAVGSGSLLVVSRWDARFVNGSLVVGSQEIDRVDPDGCPCPVISSSPGPYTPLDVDGGRIVVSGENETRILAADGKVLLTIPLPTLAAQLSGNELALADGSTLRVYDATTGALRATAQLPLGPAGHDCDLFGDPSCLQPVKLTIGDFARGLVPYSIFGGIYVLSLAQGGAYSLGAGTLPRFADAGLVYADGSRIHLVPWQDLPT